MSFINSNIPLYLANYHLFLLLFHFKLETQKDNINKLCWFEVAVSAGTGLPHACRESVISAYVYLDRFTDLIRNLWSRVFFFFRSNFLISQSRIKGSGARRAI